MPPLQLATATQLEAWLGGPARMPADPDRHLRTASRAVAYAVRVRVPDPVAAGAADPALAETLADATCAQVEGTVVGGSTTGGGTFEQTLDGTVLSTSKVEDPEDNVGQRRPHLVDDSRQILVRAGLIVPSLHTG